MLLPLQPGMARLFVYRTALVGCAIQPAVKANDESVGKAVPGGFFYVDRPAGDYEISVTTEVRRSIEVTLVSGNVRYVRLEMKLGFPVGYVRPVLVDAGVGAQEIQKTRYAGGGQSLKK